MRYSTSPPELLDQPEPSAYAITMADEFAEIMSERRAEYLAEALRGRGPFWPSGELAEWDGEQELALFRALGDAVRDDKMTDAQRWESLMMAVADEARKYAAVRTEEES